MQRISRSLMSLVAAFCVSEVLLAKGPTVKLTISGPGLSSPIDVVEKEATDPTVWGGQFIDWSSGRTVPPAAVVPQYTVQFYVKPPRGEVRMMYVVQYAWDQAAGRALVHLPGRGDEWYPLNAGTILREGQDGGWFFASDVWGRAVRKALPERHATLRLAAPERRQSSGRA